MARPLKHPIKRLVSLDPETDKKLVKKSKRNKLAPAVQIREIIKKDVEAEKA